MFFIHVKKCLRSIYMTLLKKVYWYRHAVKRLYALSRHTRGQCREDQGSAWNFVLWAVFACHLQIKLSPSLFLCLCLQGQRRTLRATGTSAVRFSRWKLSRGSHPRSVCACEPIHGVWNTPQDAGGYHGYVFCVISLYNVFKFFFNRYKVSWRLLSPGRLAKLVSIHLVCVRFSFFFPALLWECGAAQTVCVM